MYMRTIKLCIQCQHLLCCGKARMLASCLGPTYNPSCFLLRCYLILGVHRYTARAALGSRDGDSGVGIGLGCTMLTWLTLQRYLCVVECVCKGYELSLLWPNRRIRADMPAWMPYSSYPALVRVAMRTGDHGHGYRVERSFQPSLYVPASAV